MGDYISINKTMWDERAPAHAASADYGFDRFIGDSEFLSGVVRFDRPRLGDLTGQRGVHLQCHIGTDTLSLARLGARMTGLDFSSAALVHARRLAQRTGTDIDFHEADVVEHDSVPWEAIPGHNGRRRCRRMAAQHQARTVGRELHIAGYQRLTNR